MDFVQDLVAEMNKVELYDVEKDGKKIKTIECGLVCDIITVLLDKYNIGVDNDLHG